MKKKFISILLSFALVGSSIGGIPLVANAESVAAVSDEASGEEEHIVDRIAITTAPTNTLYASDEVFDSSGMVVSAYYDDAPDTAVILEAGEYSYKVDNDMLTVFYIMDPTIYDELTLTILDSPAPDKDAKDSYLLYTVNDMIWFANQVNIGNTNVNGKVMNDIDLSESEIFAGIGTSKENAYTGIFNGNNYNLNISIYVYAVSPVLPAGLFPFAGGATIKNVIVSGEVTTNANTEGIGYDNDGNRYENLPGAGGLVGRNIVDDEDGELVISNCVNEATVKGGGYAGGLIGDAEGKISITNSVNKGIVWSDYNQTMYLGGIIGRLMPTEECTIADCTNEGTIKEDTEATENIWYVGGIAGWVKNTIITDCDNYGEVTSNGVYAGGIAGYAYTTSITRCLNYGDITTLCYGAGGIIGFTGSAAVPILECGNEGCINGGNCDAGGIAGYSKQNFTINLCYNAGEVVAGYAAGGIGGYIRGTVSNSYNVGNIQNTDSENSEIGGIVGEVSQTLTFTNVYNAGVLSVPSDSSSSYIGCLAGGGNHKVTATDNCYYLEQDDYPAFGSVKSTSVISAVGYSTSAEIKSLASVMDYFCSSNDHPSYHNGYPILVWERTDGLYHTWDEGVMTEATCTEDGSVVYTCVDCQETKTEALPATGHTWDEGVVTEATCTRDGALTYTCETCGATETEVIPATGHTTVTDAAVAATCTEDGLTEGSHCSVCGEVLVAQEAIPATGHTTVTDAAVAATCTKDGLTEGSHCSVCGEVLVAQEVIPATGHSYELAVVEPSCMDLGYTTYTCTVCGDTYVSDYVANTGHTMSIIPAVEPTCTESGWTMGIKCAVDGIILLAPVETPALGHSWDAGVVTKAATASEEGVMTYTCTVCGETYTESIPKADGLADSKADDGGWYYYKNGQVDKTYTGFAQNKNGWFWVTEGQVTFTDNSVIKDSTGAIDTSKSWYYVTASTVRFTYTGVADYGNANGWWYIKDGVVDFSANTVASNKYGWWYVTGGKVQFGYTGVANYANEYGWWYIKGGKVDFSANTVAKNKYGWWYVTGGQVQFGYTGVANYANEYGWWYIKGGQVDFTFTGKAANRNGIWNVVNGKVEF